MIAPPLAGATAGNKGTFAIRPEQVRIGSHGEVTELKNHFPGEVTHFLYRGDVTVYKVRLANGVMIEALLPKPGLSQYRIR